MPACRRSLRHDPYPEGIRAIYDAAVYDGKKSCSSTNLLNSTTCCGQQPHVRRSPEHECASGALDYIHAPHALKHVR